MPNNILNEEVYNNVPLSAEDIKDNVADYSSAQIADFINRGIISYDYLCDEPQFSHKQRKEVKDLINKTDDKVNNNDEDAWQNAISKDTLEDYDFYLTNYPDGSHREEAREAKRRLKSSIDPSTVEEDWKNLNKRDLKAIKEFISRNPNSTHIQEAKAILSSSYGSSPIKQLKSAISSEAISDTIVSTIKAYIDNNKISIDDLYSEIRENRNWLAATVIKKLVENEIIDYATLDEKCNIDSQFLGYIADNELETQVINIVPEKITAIKPESTEIYFWGIPASGKTCALGAILGEVTSGDVVNVATPQKCQGYEYMTTLTQIFSESSGVFKLPEGTETDFLYEMCYLLKKNNLEYPITFIDLAGETIESMYLKNSGKELSEKQKRGLDSACKLLTGNAKHSRKIHFFVLEYGGQERKFRGRTQRTLLDGALAYIQATGIFKTETDAIYLLVSKSDLVNCDSPHQRNEKIAEYIRKHYRQFYDGLKEICKKHEINDGIVEIVPFSLGDVCFKNLCLYNPTTSKTVIELILKRALGFNTSKWSRIFKGFAK